MSLPAQIYNLLIGLHILHFMTPSRKSGTTCFERTCTGGAACDDFTGEQVCTLCESSGLVDDCEAEFDACLQADPGGNVCEKCAVIALGQCRE